jgi:broad specificity phosphatase PhoE
MAMPEHLILIRHGESEGNLAMNLAKTGDESLFTDDYVTTPGRMWALTEKGHMQARTIGAWLQAQDDDYQLGRFGRSAANHYASPFVRTRQTAGLLGLVVADRVSRPSVRWRLNRSIRERDWGDIETITRREFAEHPLLALNARKKEMDPLYWRPPGGESIVDVAENRVRNFLDTLHRECDGRTAIAVTHGEFMEATRLVLERADDETFDAWEEDKSQRIANCEVIHYTRTVPDAQFLGHFEKPGDRSKNTCWPMRDRLTYMRRARPIQRPDGAWVVEVSPWHKIEFTMPDNEGLLAGTEAHA